MWLPVFYLLQIYLKAVALPSKLHRLVYTLEFLREPT
jgi:hypothetical protein